MTEDELAAIVEGIAPVVRDFVTQAIADLALHQTATNTHLRAVLDAVKDIGPMRERLAVLETRAPVPGPVGRRVVTASTASGSRISASCSATIDPFTITATTATRQRDRHGARGAGHLPRHLGRRAHV